MQTYDGDELFNEDFGQQSAWGVLVFVIAMKYDLEKKKFFNVTVQYLGQLIPKCFSPTDMNTLCRLEVENHETSWHR
jgi:hypothetical protein